MAENNAQSTKVITGVVRLSYANLLQPRAAQDGQDPKYSASLIIPKSDKKTIRAIEKAIEAAKEMGRSSKFGGKIPPNLKTPLRDGDTERDDEAYEDSFFVNASSKTKPGIVDRNVNAIIDPEEIYSGMYVLASINFYPYNTNGNKGIAAGLNNIQKVKDGEYLGGRQSAESEFDSFDLDDDEDDLLG